MKELTCTASVIVAGADIPFDNLKSADLHTIKKGWSRKLSNEMSSYYSNHSTEYAAIN